MMTRKQKKKLKNKPKPRVLDGRYKGTVDTVDSGAMSKLKVETPTRKLVPLKKVEDETPKQVARQKAANRRNSKVNQRRYSTKAKKEKVDEHNKKVQERKNAISQNQ